ncbi:MAG: glycine C-acetyltransferase [Opitutales bacterium]|nr:glycine C-acetyltransferase [Opitutales bacterium]
MNEDFKKHLSQELDSIREAGLYKVEQEIATAQKPRMALADGKRVLNLCANNYLGLADHARVRAAAQKALDEYGFGMASVRFICGTQDQHKELEKVISDFFETEDTILYPSCFDANGGLFEVLLSEQDTVISDALNHASIIDGIRLCKARRYRYRNNDLGDLEKQLQEADAAGARFKLIATDAVFSMDGTIADLKGICDLADRYAALVMIDDCHGAGFLGKRGRGTHEHCDVIGRVDIITGTLGKALGGASGGFTTGRQEIIDLLRQRSRPYLFSNSVAPPIVAASLAVFQMLRNSDEFRRRLMENTVYYREGLSKIGLDVVPGEHPIVPIMLGDAKLSQDFAARMLQRGVFVVGFYYPVVPKGQARIRTQISAAHSRENLDYALKAFAEVKEELGI